MADRNAQGLLVLLVEDDREVHQALRALLNTEGHEVVSAYDGEEAISVLAGGAIPHVVVLDVMLPKKDGFEVCRWLRANRDSEFVPVLVYSALAGSAMRQLEGLGVARILRKADDEALLLDTIRAIARRRQAG